MGPALGVELFGGLDMALLGGAARLGALEILLEARVLGAADDEPRELCGST